MAKGLPPMTAAELTARLEADPDYVARRRARDAEFARIRTAVKTEQAPILEDLRRVGCHVESVWDLVNTSKPYPEALPILVKHLTLPYSDRTREGIARALAVKPARFAWPNLVEEYCKAPTGWGIKSAAESEPARLGVKDGLAVALSVTVTDETMPELIELLRDRSHGEYRVLLLFGLKRSKNPLVLEAIDELADDPDLAKEIASWRRSKNRMRGAPH
jgi:hypothetical protein